MRLRGFINGQNWLSVGVLVLLVSAFSLPIFWHRIMTPTENDYGSHIEFTLQILKHEKPPTYTLAHPMVQVILGGVFWLTRGKLDLWVGMVLLMVLSNVFTAVILYFWLQGMTGQRKELLRVFIALTIPLAAPVLALAPLDGRYYFGYIDLANYHNPTIQLLKPFALLVFILATRIFARSSNPTWMVFASGLLVLLSALTKQNYILSLCPAIMAMMVVAYWQKWPLDWKLGIFGFLIPAIVILALQAYVTFLLPDANQGGFMFAPLAVESAYSDYLLPKFLLSILFPLVVFLFTIKPLAKDHEMQLAWISFLAGIAQVYLFAESGNRMLDGNFRWSAQITLFVLFAASFRFIYTRYTPAWRVKSLPDVMALLAYLPHLASGIVYYVHTLTSIHYG
jgi:hypothetical protein